MRSFLGNRKAKGQRLRPNCQMANLNGLVPPHLDNAASGILFNLSVPHLHLCKKNNNTDRVGFFEDEMTYAFKALKTVSGCGVHSQQASAIIMIIDLILLGHRAMSEQSHAANPGHSLTEFCHYMLSFLRSQVIFGPALDTGEVEILGISLLSCYV